MRIRAAAYAVITRGEAAAREILLAHWRHGEHHAWTLPGGGLEAGEHPEAAVVREVQEETGFDIALAGILGVDSTVIPARQRLGADREPLHAVRIVYRARIIGGTLQNELDGSTDEAAWHRVDAIGELRHGSLVTTALAMDAGTATSV